MWTVLAVCSSFLLGLYDAAKKQALKKNGVLTVLLVATALSTLFVSPFLRIGPGADHLKLALKALLVTASWISGMVGLKLLPLTTVSMIKGSRPMFVVLFSIILFGETLNWMQWTGVLVVMAALFLLGRTSRGDASVQVRKTGFVWMEVSVLTGVASALYDKHIMAGMEPMFVQSWTNLYITILLAICIALRALFSGNRSHGRLRFPEAKALSAPEDQQLDMAGGVGGDAPRPLGVQGDNSYPSGGFRWDWWILVVAVLITGADALYFFALKQPDALLSVISVIRRGSIIITFLCGAIFFKEGNLRAKGLNMLLLAAGVVLLVLG